MQTHLEQVLTSTGLTPEQVKLLAELPADTKDFKTDEYVAPIRANVETAIKNDPKFWEGLDEKNLGEPLMKKVEAAQYGRAATIVRTNVLKAMGMTEKDFDHLGEEGKKLEVFSKAFAQKVAEGKVTDKEIQQKLIDANTKIAELEGKLPELEKAEKAKYEAASLNDKFDFIVLATIAAMPNLKVPASYVADKIAAKLKGEYAFEISGLEAGLRQKDKPTLKILVDNGTKELTLKDKVAQMLEADGLIEVKKTEPIKGTTTVTTTGGELKLGHVNDKIAKRLKEEAPQK